MNGMALKLLFRQLFTYVIVSRCSHTSEAWNNLRVKVVLASAVSYVSNKPRRRPDMSRPFQLVRQHYFH